MRARRRDGMRRRLRRLADTPPLRALVRLHRDQQGSLLDYALVFTCIAVPLIFLFGKLFDILADYFGMIAFYVTWPFL